MTALALEAGSTVSHDRLCGMLWDVLPPSAINNLRGHIATIRRYLRISGASAVAVETLRASRGGSGGGYRLTASLDDIDVHVFTRCAETAQQALRSRDCAAALRLLEEALQLWRGPAGMGATVSDALRERLDGFTLRYLDLQEDVTECLIRRYDAAMLTPDMAGSRRS
ncbi:AfsR/SARP family transcriptional regulator [Thermoactinospora rubra]|uniref:AfsR/SARP family transcriptional regulator n=1 Tax=Thermoactinospora rubra TaxID=1088767 RepID=UPI001301DEDF|nr:BTAD domain-containing putative transcriptional regulator [Thermoactinospora rubra]